MFDNLLLKQVSFPYTSKGETRIRTVTVDNIKQVDTGFFRLTGKDENDKWKSFNLYQNQIQNVKILSE